jgi:hypothetical protein
MVGVGAFHGRNWALFDAARRRRRAQNCAARGIPQARSDVCMNDGPNNDTRSAQHRPEALLLLGLEFREHVAASNVVQ